MCTNVNVLLFVRERGQGRMPLNGKNELHSKKEGKSGGSHGLRNLLDGLKKTGDSLRFLHYCSRYMNYCSR